MATKGRRKATSSKAVAKPRSRKKQKANDVRPTGIDKLDELLNGGVLTFSTILLSGGAGVGKTTLAAQWLSKGVDKYGESGIYITMTEPPHVLLHNLQKFSFYSTDNVVSSDLRLSDFSKESAEEEGIHFVDFRTILAELKLIKSKYTYKDVEAIHDALVTLVTNSGAKRIVFDSMTALKYLLGSDDLTRNFIFLFSKYLSLLQANTMLIGEASKRDDQKFHLEEFIVDGVIELRYDDDDIHNFRQLRIKKMRGVDFKRVFVPYNISLKHGVSLYPSIQKTFSRDKSGTTRVLTGIPGLEQITNGGFIEGSSILVSGPSGSGKSLLALQSMHESLKSKKNGLIVSFEESKTQILRNANAFGWDLAKFEKKGTLTFITVHPEERHLSELLSTITSLLKKKKPEKIIIDSVSSLARVHGDKAVSSFISQLLIFTKQHNVTALFTAVTPDLLGSGSASELGFSSLFDSMIVLRYVEIDSEFKHALFVLKMRGTKHTKVLHNFVFTDDGLRVTEPFKGYQNIFLGSATRISETVESEVEKLLNTALGPIGSDVFEEQRLIGLSSENLMVLFEQLARDNIITSAQKENLIQEVNSIFNGE